MSDVFSLLGFCEIAKRFFKILVFNREWFAQKLDMYGQQPQHFSSIRHLGQKLTVINLKLFCKVVTNQSATGKLTKCIKVPVL